ncbi:MAG TPA: alpha/beta hydrolase [Micromonosporaceae bacterium]
MQPTQVSVTVGPGVTLQVRHWQGGPRVPFVLVHGLSSNARLWDAVARELAGAGHAAFAVDLRSHGVSPAAETGYDTATAADDVAAVIEELHLAPAVVAGQSWGGNVVVRLAAQRPDLVAALALVDGGWIDLTEQFDTWEQAEAALRPPAVDGMRGDDLRDRLRGWHPGWSAEAIEATLANLREVDGQLERRLSIPRHMSIVRSMWDDPPWRDFAQITTPVLLLPALSDDPAVAAPRRAAVEKAAGALARAAVREFVGADHDIHAQHPDLLASELLTLAGAV